MMMQRRYIWQRWQGCYLCRKWQGWNKADKTLLAAAVIFLFALCLYIRCRDNVLAAGFLFCAEAALVGGIADWFAVTALFEKPLGFPWHTAILPRRRQAFIEVTGRMLQREFFGKKVLVAKLKEADYAAGLLDWLAQKEHRELLADWLHGMIKKWLLAEGGSLAEKIPDRLAGRLAAAAGEAVSAARVRDVMLYGARELAERIGQPDFLARTGRALDAYIDSRLDGPMSMMLAGLAQSVNIINTGEAAELIQSRCLLLLERARQADSEEAVQLMAAAEKITAFLQKNSAVKQELGGVLLNLVKGTDLNKCLFNTTNTTNGTDGDTINGDIINGNTIDGGAGNGDAGNCITGSCIAANCNTANAAGGADAGLRELSGEIVDAVYRVIRESGPLRSELNGMCYQLTARGALQAQELLGSIVSDVLGTMTDKQINRLVYDKAEPDLLWIRMNGSIVGAAIGLVIFAVLQLI